MKGVSIMNKLVTLIGLYGLSSSKIPSGADHNNSGINIRLKTDKGVKMYSPQVAREGNVIFISGGLKVIGFQPGLHSHVDIAVVDSMMKIIKIKKTKIHNVFHLKGKSNINNKYKYNAQIKIGSSVEMLTLKIGYHGLIFSDTLDCIRSMAPHGTMVN